MELHHFSHQHPLILHKELKENDDDREIACYGCEKPIMGPYYSCRDCNFFMHSSCAELPTEIQHWLHPNHTLTLAEKWRFRCDACGHLIRNLAYNCSLCKFNIDLRCVSIPQTIEHCGHGHPFTLLTKRVKFCCDACGAEGDGMSYLCTTCQFLVHLDCVSLRSIIKLSDHVHPLTLAYSLDGDESRQCGICDEAVKTNHWVYHCADCSYLAHVDCTIVPKRYFIGKLMRQREGERDRQIDNMTKAETDRDSETEAESESESEAETDRDSETEAQVEAESEAEAETESCNHYLPNLDLNLSASLRKTLVHWGHEHPLRLMVNDVDFDCDACGTEGKASFSYICTMCRFWVHPGCALLPKIIKLGDHDHLYTLTPSSKLDYSYDCAKCNREVNNCWVYCCTDFHRVVSVVHVHCAKKVIRKAGIILRPNDDDDQIQEPESSLIQLPDEYNHLPANIDVEKLSLGEKKTAGELKHFSHPHSLTLCEEDMGGKHEKCHGCSKPLSSPAYVCANNCKYFLHKTCAELPREILKHPLHPQHPLALLLNPPYPCARCLCSFCSHSVTHFVYHCSLCKFNLDLRCVSLPSSIQHFGHEHPLIPLQKPAKFCCYACGTEGKDYTYSYLCTTSLILFHLECVSSAKTIKLKHHDHSLKLCFNVDYNYPIEYLCVVCNDRVKLDRWYYVCEELSCNGAAHLHCAKSEKEPSRAPIILMRRCHDGARALDPKPIPDESIFLTADDDVKNCAGEKTTATELNHSSHQHCLTLCHDELKIPRQCDGCTQPIIASPFYSCPDCNFYLHELCTQLRSEIRHPLHLEHRLKLIVKTRDSDDGFFYCSMCWNCCSGFSYSCEYCDFGLDIVCSSILGDLKHGAHEHVLSLSGGEGRYQRSCKACRLPITSCSIMSCYRCNFYLHIECVTLPQTVWHKIHRHPFTLTYIPTEDDLDECYCDICEEERNPEQWFYNCAKCEYPAHVSCMVGTYPRLKFSIVPNDSVKKRIRRGSHNVLCYQKFKAESTGVKPESLLDEGQNIVLSLIDSHRGRIDI